MDLPEEFVPEEYEYTVVLVFPGFGPERENAESIVESALQWLNTYQDEPGFRFAPGVKANLEIVRDVEAARDMIAEDENVVMVLLHDVEGAERDELVRHCETAHVSACYTVDAPRRSGRRKQQLEFTLSTEPRKGGRAHSIAADTLTDPLDDGEVTGRRIGEVIAVLALGVMEQHWRKNPPFFGLLDT